MLMNGKWLDNDTLSVNSEYVGSDLPGTGSNVLEDGQIRLWYDTNTSITKIVSRVGSTYYTTDFFNGNVDGGSF